MAGKSNNKISDLKNLNFGEFLGYYLKEKGIVDSPLAVAQATLDRLTNSISYIRRDGHGDLEYYSPTESGAELFFIGLQGYLNH